MYAQIVFPIASLKSFTYKIPKQLIKQIAIGSAVNATFRNTISMGYVISLSDYSQYQGKIYPIDSVNVDTCSIPPDLWRTIIWMSNYYMAPLGISIKSALSVSFYKENFNNKKLHISLSSNYSQIIENTHISKGEKALVDKLLLSSTPIAVSTLKKSIKNIYYWIDKLINKKIIVKKYISINNSISNDNSSSIVTLSDSQQKIFNHITPSITDRKHKSFLLYGVPGSGKTEIYIKLAQETIASGKQVIVLIPEIILTTQMKSRFIKYFGNIVSIWHSKMTKKGKT